MQSNAYFTTHQGDVGLDISESCVKLIDLLTDFDAGICWHIAIKFVYGIKKNMAPPGIFDVKTPVKYVILKI